MISTKLFDFWGNDMTHRVRFFGGGGKSSKPPKQEEFKMPEMPQIQIPKPPKPAPPIPPPPTATNADVQQQADDTRRQAKNRKGLRSTLLAGETRNQMAATTQGKKTLLG